MGAGRDDQIDVATWWASRAAGGDLAPTSGVAAGIRRRLPGLLACVLAAGVTVWVLGHAVRAQRYAGEVRSWVGHTQVLSGYWVGDRFDPPFFTDVFEIRIPLRVTGSDGAQHFVHQPSSADARAASRRAGLWWAGGLVLLVGTVAGGRFTIRRPLLGRFRKAA